MTSATSLYVTKVRTLPTTAYQPWVISFSSWVWISLLSTDKDTEMWNAKEVWAQGPSLEFWTLSLPQGCSFKNSKGLFIEMIMQKSACIGSVHLNEFSQTKHISVTRIQIHIPYQHLRSPLVLLLDTVLPRITTTFVWSVAELHINGIKQHTHILSCMASFFLRYVQQLLPHHWL